MAYIHNKGYTHRDLKSQNILYDRADGRAKVADFGMSRACNNNPGGATGTADNKTSRPQQSTVLMTGMAGTAPWMAPELCQNEVAIDEKFASIKSQFSPRNRASLMESFAIFQADHQVVEYGASVDVYAFGVTMWEMLTHRMPWYDKKSAPAIYAAVASGKRPAVPATEPCTEPAPVGWVGLMEACWAQNALERPTFTQR